jgi:hypothetical protein
MMNKQFNEAELYLLKNWRDAALLEESMNAVRKEYANILDEVLKTVCEENEGCTPVNRINAASGYVGITKKSWLSSDSRYPSGLWIDCIAVDILASEDEEAPDAAVWIEPPRDSGLDLKEATNRFYKEAKQRLSKDELARVKPDDDRTSAAVWYYLPEPRHKLLEMLQTDEAREFKDCMIGHFELLSRFIPILDEIFQTSGQKRT